MKQFNLDTLQEEEVKKDKEEVQEKSRKLSPFDFIESITNGFDNIIKSDFDLSSYVPFVVNRGLAMGADTVFYANEMNKYNHLDKDIQYNFLRHSVKKGKRYNSWAKEAKIQDINTVMDYYHINKNMAVEYLKLLSPEQINKIKNDMARAEGKIV